ncbi:hypothetical protein [uncultured Desulfovibrio sp.]
MADRKITIRALVALSGLSDKTVLRTRNEHRVECRLYTCKQSPSILGSTD